MRHLWLSALFVPAAVCSAPFIVSDSTTYTPAPTSCGLFMDAAAKQVVPVALDANSKPYCKFDINTVSTGSHTVTATFIVDDPIWGARESAKSVPFVFTGPPAPSSPAALKLTQ